jgi:hypothetical protein
MTTSDDQREAILAVLNDPQWKRNNHVNEWPDDEAEAYRELRWEEGANAALRVLHGKQAHAIIAALSTRPALPAGDEGHGIKYWGIQVGFIEHPTQCIVECRCGEVFRPTTKGDPRKQEMDVKHQHEAHVAALASRPSPAPTPAADDHAALIADLTIAEELTGTQWADTSPRYYPAVRRIFSFARRVLEGEVKNDVD